MFGWVFVLSINISPVLFYFIYVLMFCLWIVMLFLNGMWFLSMSYVVSFTIFVSLPLVCTLLNSLFTFFSQIENSNIKLFEIDTISMLMLLNCFFYCLLLSAVCLRCPSTYLNEHYGFCHPLVFNIILSGLSVSTIWWLARKIILNRFLEHFMHLPLVNTNTPNSLHWLSQCYIRLWSISSD